MLHMNKKWIFALIAFVTGNIFEHRKKVKYNFFFTHLKTNTQCSNPPGSSDEPTYITGLLSKCFHSLIHSMLTCQLQPTAWLIRKLICSSHQTPEEHWSSKVDRNKWCDLNVTVLQTHIWQYSTLTQQIAHIFITLPTSQSNAWSKCTAVLQFVPLATHAVINNKTHAWQILHYHWLNDFIKLVWCNARHFPVDNIYVKSSVHCMQREGLRSDLMKRFQLGTVRNKK